MIIKKTIIKKPLPDTGGAQVLIGTVALFAGAVALCARIVRP